MVTASKRRRRAAAKRRTLRRQLSRVAIGGRSVTAPALSSGPNLGPDPTPGSWGLPSRLFRDGRDGQREGRPLSFDLRRWALDLSNPFDAGAPSRVAVRSLAICHAQDRFSGAYLSSAYFLLAPFSRDLYYLRSLTGGLSEHDENLFRRTAKNLVLCQVIEKNLVPCLVIE